MLPIDRDTQIKLMKDSENRLSELVDGYLRIPNVRAAAMACPFAKSEPDVTVKQVRVTRRA